MSDVNNKILDAIELLAKNSVERAGYDKTIQAQIISCQDPSIGKYKCKYQDAMFYAYVGNPEITLTNNTYVYVLVPENNMSKDKTIIGTVDKLGVDYITSAIGEQAYNIIGNDVIQDTGTFYLDIDYADYSYALYDEDNSYQDQNLGFNITALNQYIKQASSILIGATIKTTIPQPKRQLGNYGIKFIIEFKDDKGNIGIEREYILDEDRMIDNPYNLAQPTRQYAIFDIDNQNFVKVKKIIIFNKDFPNSSGESHTKLNNGQIELTNLELKCAARMTEEELNGLSLSVIAPRGLLFLNSADRPKILQAQVKFKGRAVPAANVSFYWGIEDLQINPQRQTEYNKYLGRGWRCINNYNIVQAEGGARSIQWASYGDTYEFEFSQALVTDNRMRVAAVYDGNAITKQINIQNLTSSAGVITIESSNGTEFHYGIGQTQLQCSISNISYTSLVYAWGWQNGGGELEQLSSTINTLAVQAKYITNFAIYRCSVYDRYGGEDHLIGTGLIKLTNSMEEGNVNPLMIENGTALYKYNEKGISPTSRTLQNPQIVQVLSFKLYNDVGEEIQIFHNHLIDSRANVKWRVPTTNTLLKLPDPPQTTEDGYYIVQNTETLTYDLEQRYDVRKTINQIILQVTYDGATSIAQTNLTFTKQGQIGTNGTDYYVNIMPNTSMANPPLFPMITKFYGEGNVCKLNYDMQVGASSTRTITEGTAYQLLKVQFLHGGEVISSGYTTKWRVLRNHYYGSGQSSIDDASDFSIPDNDNSKLIYTHSLVTSSAQVAANVIECQITYDGHTYYSAIPFITAYMNTQSLSFDLKDGTGFHYVMYSSEGMQPEYASLPFEFIDPDGQAIEGTCGVYGNIKVKSGNSWALSNSNDLIQDSQDQCKIQPIGFYKGECVNNAVRYQVSGVGVISIPIHFYLNRYNFAHLNGWDGNSIQINEEDGYILAPQVAAGQKQDDNSFTGVLMGEVKNPAKSQSDVGLFGYAEGERSFFINSKNGSAIFGKSGNGEIIIDPGNDKAMLYSHNFWRTYNSQTGLPSSYLESNYADAGMLVDLTTPQIVFKNKMLWLTSDGAIYAGKRTENNVNYYNFSVDSTGNVQMVGDLKAGRISGTNNYNFEVNNSATGNNPLIRAGYDSGAYNFIVEADGDVSLKGAITANSGKIGGINGWTIGYAAASGSVPARGYIYSGSRTSLDSTASGIYIGTDGISAYKSGTGITFKVDANGNVLVNGDITLGPNSSISWDALPSNVADEDDLADVAFSGDYDDLSNQPTIPVLPSYITSTKITRTTIESPDIIGGKIAATGTGESGAAFKIYDGYTPSTQTYGDQLAYIMYDNQGAGTSEQAQKRIIFASKETGSYRYPLKIISASNLSLEATPITTWSSVAGGYISVGGAVFISGNYTRFTGTIKVPPANYLNNDRDFEGVYGYTLPNPNYLSSTQDLGRVFFKLINN